MADRYVKSDGNNGYDGTREHPWATLQYAITNTGRPGTIYLLDGLTGQPYFGNTGSGLLTIQPEGTPTSYAYGVTMDWSNAHATLGACSNLLFKNIRFINNAAGGGYLTMSADSVDMTAIEFRDCTLESSDNVGRNIFKGTGTLTLNRCTFKNADTTGSGYFGLVLQGLTTGLSPTIRDCRFDNPQQRNGTFYGILPSLVFTGNTVAVPGRTQSQIGHGFRFGDWSTTPNTIGRIVCLNNTFDTGSASVGRCYFYHADNVLIQGNSFHNYGDCCSIDQCLGVDFGFNTMEASANSGDLLLLAGNKYCRVHHNKFINVTPTTGSDVLWIHGTNYEHSDPGDWRHTVNLDFSFDHNYVKIRNANAFFYSNQAANLCFDLAGQFVVDRNCYDWAGAEGRTSNIFTTATALTLAAQRARWVAEGLPLCDGTNSVNDRHSVAQEIWPDWTIGDQPDEPFEVRYGHVPWRYRQS